MNTRLTQTNTLRIRNPEAYRNEQHRCYAGELYLSDFQTVRPDGRIAKKILHAETFDDTCRINGLIRQYKEDFSHE